jgi:hypothetical protein
MDTAVLNLLSNQPIHVLKDSHPQLPSFGKCMGNWQTDLPATVAGAAK